MMGTRCRGERIGGDTLRADRGGLLPAAAAVIIGTSFTTTAFLRFPPEGFTLPWYGKFLNDPSYLQSML